MRTFRDSSDIEWTVFEVRRAGEESNWAYLPRGFRSGWLCFESTAGKRRLSPVPDGWKLLEPADLTVMLQRATPVGRPGRSDGPHDSTRRFPRGDSEASA
jgi:hypothetical protein